MSTMENLCILLLVIVVVAVSGCAGTTAVKPEEADYGLKKGRLITVDGYKFSYKYYPAAMKGPTVLFVPGMGGRPTWGGAGAYALADPLNELNVNYISYVRAGALMPGSGRGHVANTQKRSKSGAAMYPSKDGKESAAQNIVRNEMAALLKYIEESPMHDSQKGIYLLGGSFGALVSLETVSAFPNEIQGVVFVSPAVVPALYTQKWQNKYNKYDVIEHFEKLINAFGDRPALAIGGAGDRISQRFPGSALDAANFLHNKIGDTLDVMEVKSSRHSYDLIEGDKRAREAIIEYIKTHALN